MSQQNIKNIIMKIKFIEIMDIAVEAIANSLLFIL